LRRLCILTIGLRTPSLPVPELPRWWALGTYCISHNSNIVAFLLGCPLRRLHIVFSGLSFYRMCPNFSRSKKIKSKAKASIIVRRIPIYPRTTPAVAKRLPLYLFGSRFSFDRDIWPQITAGIPEIKPNITQLRKPRMRLITASGAFFRS